MTASRVPRRETGSRNVPAEHIFYIPVIFVAGLLLGQVLGRRALTQELAEREREEQRRKARQQDA